MSRVFDSKYGGECGACGQGYPPGTPVLFSRKGDLIHARCPKPKATGEICPTCFTAKSLTGTCDNCD